MRWYEQLITGTSVAGIVFGLALAAASGLALGSIKVRGLSLGIAGVLFTGIAYADLFWNHGLVARLAPAQTIAALEGNRRQILEFLRELGLVLFVYSIGMEIGPGFFASLRARGLRFSLLVVALVSMNVLVALGMHRWLKVDAVAAVGILSGAVTNTPGLAAAEQALRDLPGLTRGQPGLAEVGCAVAYPFGILGTILALVVARGTFRAWAARAGDAGQARPRRRPLAAIDLCAVNPAVIGHRIGDLTALLGAPVVVSRLMRQGEVELPGPNTELRRDDLLHAVGEQKDLDRLAVLLGGRSAVDLRDVSDRLSVRRLVVTRAEVAGKTLADLDVRARHGVNVTRIQRAGIEIVPGARTELSYGDTVVAVGESGGLAQLEAQLGNAVAELDHPQLVPIFLGITAGVLVGLIPISLAGLPQPVRLGLAGGPLVVALVASYFGRVGRISFYLPTSASLMLRDFGIVLFLGCVGLMSGERFVQTLVSGPGLRWIVLGAAITFPPLVVAEVIARRIIQLDYPSFCGVVAGSMTSPPVLAFANQFAGEEAAVAYGSVYPLAMVLRIISAQLLVVLWVGSGAP